ncbi:MAG: hypothetical protein ACRC1L_01320 [Prochlorococcaceae cyanobacterium]
MVIADQPVPADLEQQLPSPLRLALNHLLERAPSALFPRARQLYFLKVPLEGHPQDLDSSPFAERFRTFVLRETTCLPSEENQQPHQPITRINELAVVHWQAPQTNLEDYANYISRHWLLEPQNLGLCEQPWFREGGAWARVSLTGPAGVPAPAPAVPDSTP